MLFTEEHTIWHSDFNEFHSGPFASAFERVRYFPFCRFAVYVSTTSAESNGCLPYHEVVFPQITLSDKVFSHSTYFILTTYQIETRARAHKLVMENINNRSVFVFKFNRIMISALRCDWDRTIFVQLRTICVY